MTRRIVVVLVALAALAVATFYVTSKDAPQIAQEVEARGVDLVGGIAPASTALGGIHGYAQELANLPPEERAARIDQARPRINQAVVYFLRDMGRIKANEEIERVEIFFGSVEGTRAHDGAGNEHKGYFKNELVARVHLKGGRTEDALVRCLNLWLDLPAHIDRLQRLSSTPFAEVKSFTIGAGEGLIHHVDYAVAMDLAQRHQLPLYRGRRQVGQKRITPDVARELEGNTSHEQVTVAVIEGDKFDLAAGTFEPSPRRQR